VTVDGRLFHALAAATRNARSPSDDILVPVRRVLANLMNWIELNQCEIMCLAVHLKGGIPVCIGCWHLFIQHLSIIHPVRESAVVGQLFITMAIVLLCMCCYNLHTTDKIIHLHSNLILSVADRGCGARAFPPTLTWGKFFSLWWFFYLLLQPKIPQCIKLEFCFFVMTVSGLLIPPLPPLGHIWDVMLVWRKGNINKNCLCVTVLCTIIMVHKDTSSSYRSVDCIRASVLVGLALCPPSSSVSSAFMVLYRY